MSKKIKVVIMQKEKLEEELWEAKAETEKIRREMFAGYQDIIVKLKDEILGLKEQNVILGENNDSKVKIAQLEREIKITNSKNADLLARTKDLESSIQKLESRLE